MNTFGHHAHSCRANVYLLTCGMLYSIACAPVFYMTCLRLYVSATPSALDAVMAAMGPPFVFTIGAKARKTSNAQGSGVSISRL